MVNNYLNAKMRTTVVEFDECKEIALFTSCAGPTGYFNNMIKILFMIFVESCYSDAPSVSKVWHWLLFYGDISFKFVFDFSLIPRIFRASTITSISSWFCFRCFRSLKLARTSFPFSFVSLSES